MNPIKIYSDGSCNPNPGPGGWGAVIIGQERREIKGRSNGVTTNNRMELTGAIEALKTLAFGSEVIVYTDSTYLQQGASNWLFYWRRRKFKNVKNDDLWRELDSVMSQLKVKWKWMRSHQKKGNENDRADVLAGNR